MDVLYTFNSDSDSVSTRFPAGIYLVKGNNGNIRTICENLSKLTIKTQETSVNSEQI